MNETTLAALRTIEAAMARAVPGGRVCERIAPFLATVDPTSELIWLSHAYVIPEEPMPEDLAPVIERLRSFYRQHNRRMRFELLAPLHPELGAKLEALGVTLQARMPLMLCTPGDLRPVQTPGLSIEWMTPSTSDDSVRDAVRLKTEAFGESLAGSEDDSIQIERRYINAGRMISLLARLDGVPVGAGSLSLDNFELAGIATAPAFRRRGIGATVSSILVEELFERGEPFAWLSAGNDIAEAVYRRIGFRDAGDQLNYIDPPLA
jgi:ribosomal protein S18 acetylase RimI-like enzyme